MGGGKDKSSLLLSVRDLIGFLQPIVGAGARGAYELVHGNLHSTRLELP